MSDLEVTALPTAEDVLSTVVSELIDYIEEQTAKGADVHIALTGGTIGIAINEALLSNETVRSSPNVHFWFSDERYVPRGHADRNDLNLESLLDGCAAKVHHIAGPDTSESVEASALAYAQELHLATTTRFCADNTMMDIAVIGLGPDGHIASIFPHSETLSATAAVVAVTDSPKPPPVRVSWTYPTINASRQTWIVATGAAKADAVARILESEFDSDDARELALAQTPARGVNGKHLSRLIIDFSAAE